MAFWIMLFTFLIAVFVTPVVANAWLAGRRLAVIRAAVERGHPFDPALLDSGTVRAWRLHPRLFVIAGVLSMFMGAGFVGMALAMMPSSAGKPILGQALVWMALGIGLFIAHFIKGKSDRAAP
jgi:drug/metabolite transporter (DMT)-like permease